MANQDYLHTAEILKAALPYFDSMSRIRMEFYTKVLDLMGSLNTLSGRNSMVACGYENTSIDFEGLLNGIRPLCEGKERDIIDRILNIFNMKRMFEMYNNLMSTMKTMQEFGGFSFTDEDSKDDTDTVTGNFMGSMFESIFRGGGSENTRSEDTASEDDQDHTHRSESSSTNDNPMFEMLKTMMPPEQQSTFENLRMLLNTMSYDNNSKSDDSKEQENG
ncbi:MAG: hypothetical protein K0R34_1108 [Herbinix sp.]|nr:hypothetical protein [Herbinix sp.]